MPALTAPGSPQCRLRRRLAGRARCARGAPRPWCSPGRDGARLGFLTGAGGGPSQPPAPRAGRRRRHRCRPTPAPGPPTQRCTPPRRHAPPPNGCVIVGWYPDTANHHVGLIETPERHRLDRHRGPQPYNAGSRRRPGLLARFRGLRLRRAVSRRVVPDGDVLRRGRAVPQDACGYLRAARRDPRQRHLDGNAGGPLPSDSATDVSGRLFPDALLFSVSCASATSCAAVGQYPTTGGTRRPTSRRFGAPPGAALRRRFRPASGGTSHSSGSPARQRPPAPRPAPTGQQRLNGLIESWPTAPGPPRRRPSRRRRDRAAGSPVGDLRWSARRRRPVSPSGDYEVQAGGSGPLSTRGTGAPGRA